MKHLPDLTGQRYGQLVVRHRVDDGASTSGGIRWRCSCDCGKDTVVPGPTLLRGHTQSCGCLRRAKCRGIHRFRLSDNIKHGYARRGSIHPIYSVWATMVQRCTNPRNPDFAFYGGRGITLCERWREFTYFLADVSAEIGDCPRGHTLDRINNDGGYEPGNIRWATRREQAHNSRRVRWLTANGVRANLDDWMIRLQVPRHVLVKWIRSKAIQELLRPDHFSLVGG